MARRKDGRPRTVPIIYKRGPILKGGPIEIPPGAEVKTMHVDEAVDFINALYEKDDDE